jgi:hypothetical protein
LKNPKSKLEKRKWYASSHVQSQSRIFSLQCINRQGGIRAIPSEWIEKGLQKQPYKRNSFDGG